MQYNNQECIELLKQLISGHRARIAAYTGVLSSLDPDADAGLMLELENIAQQSQQMKAQLTPLVFREGEGDSDPGDTWQDFPTPDQFSTSGTADISTIKTGCMQVEDALIARYREANHCNEMIEEQIKELISSQAKLLEDTREQILQQFEERANSN